MSDRFMFKHLPSSLEEKMGFFLQEKTFKSSLFKILKGYQTCLPLMVAIFAGTSIGHWVPGVSM